MTIMYCLLYWGVTIQMISGGPWRVSGLWQVTRPCHGQNIAIVGPSGSGKSTIIALLERFYALANGNVLVNDHLVQSLDLR